MVPAQRMSRRRRAQLSRVGGAVGDVLQVRGGGRQGKAREGAPDSPLSLEIGLCLNMRSLPWYAQANPDAFFPRCYGLGSDSEKQEFLGR